MHRSVCSVLQKMWGWECVYGVGWHFASYVSSFKICLLFLMLVWKQFKNTVLLFAPRSSGYNCAFREEKKKESPFLLFQHLWSPYNLNQCNRGQSHCSVTVKKTEEAEKEVEESEIGLTELPNYLQSKEDLFHPRLLIPTTGTFSCGPISMNDPWRARIPLHSLKQYLEDVFDSVTVHFTLQSFCVGNALQLCHKSLRTTGATVLFVCLFVWKYSCLEILHW